ncbi:hypothetical protein [[Eubacterium] cellulosolvens]
MIAKMGKILSFSIIALLLVSATAIMVSSAYSQRPIINSQWTANPPDIDGMFMPGEWSNLQIIMRDPDYPIDANAYFLNDDFNLYVLVDAMEDTIENVHDECLLVFDFNEQIVIRIVGTSESWTQSSTVFDAAIGFDSSPNNPNDHKIYEFSIPLNLINMQPGQSIDFCSPFWKNVASIPYDPDGGISNDNVWPPGIGTDQEWQGNKDLWGILSTGRYAPVGGIVTPVNKAALLSPYLALIAIIGVVISIAIKITKN